MNSKSLPAPKTSELRRPLGKIVVTTCLALASVITAHAQSVWTGASGTWSSNGSPGWNGTGVPVAGTTANLGSSATKTVTLDVSGTTGSLFYDGSGNTITTMTLTGGLTFDNSGSASALSNTNTNAGTSNRLSIAGGTITLVNDLTISNSGNSSNTSGAITLSSTALIAGSGALTISNVSNSLAAGAITMSGASTFTGSVLIQKGILGFSYSSGTSFGNSANVVTVGQSGQGDASFINTSSNNTIGNSIIIAAGSGGTSAIGSSSGAAASNTTFAGTILLNGSVSLTSSKGAGADVRYTNVLSGAGGVTTVGTGETQFGNGTASITNTYLGNTTLTQTSSLVLSDNAKLTFTIGATGVNNTITATGGNNNTLTLDGDFVFDLTGAGSTVGNSWAIVDVSLLNETFSSSFTVASFVADGGGDLWTKDINGTNYYQFSEATGVLSVVPEPGACALLGFGLTVLLFRRRRL
ncbi:MAG: PEP-CTERM sorting domain-containing protein [Terrimicrobiaceae bacterium]